MKFTHDVPIRWPTAAMLPHGHSRQFPPKLGRVNDNSSPPSSHLPSPPALTPSHLTGVRGITPEMFFFLIIQMHVEF